MFLTFIVVTMTHDPMNSHNPTLYASADDLITQLSTVSINPSQAERLKFLLPDKAPVDIHDEIESQYLLMQQVRAELLNPNGDLKESVAGKELQSVFAQFNSFMNLYLRAMERLDRDRQLTEIEQAVTSAMKEAPKEVQDAYMEALEDRLR